MFVEGRPEEILVGIVSAALAVLLAIRIRHALTKGVVPIYKKRITRSEVGEAKFNFANFDLVPEVDIDALFLDYLPRVRSSVNTADYYLVLMEFIALLRDGHTNVAPPPSISRSFNPVSMKAMRFKPSSLLLI